MAGHSKWKQIKSKKAATDERRGQLFSKLLGAIRAAARGGPHPEFNPRLKAAIAKARAENVPQENIARAIGQPRSAETYELLIEAYGPGGLALLISAVTDNKNRTLAEIKKILHEFGGKVAEPGSVLWAFHKTDSYEWLPKFPQAIDENTKEKMKELLSSLDEEGDIIRVYTNIAS